MGQVDPILPLCRADDQRPGCQQCKYRSHVDGFYQFTYSSAGPRKVMFGEYCRSWSGTSCRFGILRVYGWSRESGTQAEVDSVTEGDVLARVLPADIEL